MPEKRLNRIRVVLAEKEKTSRQLANYLEVAPNTVSRWCRNVSQPDLQTIHRIANYLGVQPGELLTTTR